MKKAIEAAVVAAYAYLLDTEWTEFSTLRHGPSTAVDWIGGFIRRCLPDLPGTPAEVFPRFSAKSSNDLDSEANWAVVTGNPINGWYDHQWLRGKSWSTVYGGLSTYCREEIRQMYDIPYGEDEGWIMPQFEVTALALQCQWAKTAIERPRLDWALAGEYCPYSEEYLQEHTTNSLRRRAKDYLCGCFDHWNDFSYWWSTDSYGWHQASELATDECFNLKSLVYKRIQTTDPYLNRYGETCPFTTGLNLMSWMRVMPDNEIIQLLTERLLDMQQSDGSWHAPAIMRIPEPRVMYPTLDCRRVPEDKGLLTTATVAQALKRYLHQLG